LDLYQGDAVISIIAIGILAASVLVVLTYALGIWMLVYIIRYIIQGNKDLD